MSDEDLTRVFYEAVVDYGADHGGAVEEAAHWRALDPDVREAFRAGVAAVRGRLNDESNGYSPVSPVVRECVEPYPPLGGG